MRSIRQRRGWGKRPTVIALHQRGTQQGAAVIDADGAARFGGTVERWSGIVSQLPVAKPRVEHTPPATSSTTEVRSGADGAIVSTLIINSLEVGLTFPAASVAMAVKTCWPLPSVAGRYSQTIYCRSHRRQQHAIIVDGYPGTGFRRAVQYGASIIGVSAVRQRSGSRHHVIKSPDNRWRKRSNSINNDVKSSGRWTNVFGCVGCCHRQRVVAVANAVPGVKLRAPVPSAVIEPINDPLS